MKHPEVHIVDLGGSAEIYTKDTLDKAAPPTDNSQFTDPKKINEAKNMILNLKEVQWEVEKSMTQ